MNLYTVNVPDVSSNQPTMPLSFGKPKVVMDWTKDGGTSGILDGKWSSILPSSPGQARNNQRFDNSRFRASWAFATAHSSGEIRIHAFQVPNNQDDYSDVPTLPSDPLYEINYLGKSSKQDSREKMGSHPTPLCLALNWDNARRPFVSDGHSNSYPTPQRIVSSYSNGRVAIHDVVFLNHEDRGHEDSKQEVQIVERDSWHAHSMFTSPSEVWSACFAGANDTTTVLSAGDEGKLKFWDIRSTSRPIRVLENLFEAGVTCVSPHPRYEHLVACGSYDERIALFDARYIQTQPKAQPLFHTDKLGGGIWRIQWHPCNDHRVLVAAMHGGGRVLNIKGFDRYCRENRHYPMHGHTSRTQPTSLYHPAIALTASLESSTSFDTAEREASGMMMKAKVKKRFNEHESMAYGAGWLVCRHPKHQNSYFEAAASCSFYDRAAYLWDSVF